MMVDVLEDIDLKEQLLTEMQHTLIKWKKQINLLDRETAAIINELDEIVTKKSKKSKEARAA